MNEHGDAHLVQVENEQVVTDSRKVAEVFGKEHKNVIQAIENITAENSAVSSMFYETDYTAGTGKHYKMYLMNRDGFTLLAMGFTGKQALEWKLKYIKAFNDMEAELKAKQEPKSQIDILVESAKALQRQERGLARLKLTQEEHAESLRIVSSRVDTLNCVCTEGTKRQKLVAMINAYSNKHGLTYREGWHRFKQAYNFAFHTSLGNSISFYMKDKGLKKKPSVPDFLEKKELLDDAMRIADKLLNAGGVCVG
jgi:Rha family phage regulatory protein